MEEILLSLIGAALMASIAVSGIVQVIKKNSKIEGLWIIAVAVLVGVLLLGAIAVIFGLPLAENLLLGVLSGLASVGAFESYKHVKEE